MSEKRFVVQEDVNTDKIILLIDYKRMKRYSFLAEEREAVNKICNYLNWFDECTDNYVVMLKEIEESNCEKTKEIAKLKKKVDEQQSTITRLEEENDKMRIKGLTVLDFYEGKLKDVIGSTEDFQSVRDEIWIVKHILYEMGVLNDE